jgi:hypothetical protein
MSDTVYDIPLYFPFSQGDKWTYSHKAGGEVKEVSYLIEGSETFHGIKVPKKVQVENREEFFCTYVDPVLGIRDFKHNIGMTSQYLIYTPPTIVIPAKMKAGDIHYNTSHLFRHNQDGIIEAEGSFYATTILEAVENVTVPAGEFKNCLKIVLIKDDVFSDMVVNVVQTQWVAKKVGTVKDSVKVNIYSPEGGDPFKVEASEELTHVEIDGIRY